MTLVTILLQNYFFHKNKSLPKWKLGLHLAQGSSYLWFVICTTILACFFLLFCVTFLFLIFVLLVFFLVLHVYRFINMCGNIKLLCLWSLKFLLFCVIVSCSFFFTFGLLLLFPLLDYCCCPSLLLLLPSLWCMHVSLFNEGFSLDKKCVL